MLMKSFNLQAASSKLKLFSLLLLIGIVFNAYNANAQCPGFLFAAYANPDPVCLGSDLSITVSGQNAQTVQMNYIDANGNTGSASSNTSNHTFVVNTVNLAVGTMTIFASAVQANGCSESTSFTVTISFPQITGVSITASGASTAPFPLTLTTTAMGGTPPYTFHWLEDGKPLVPNSTGNPVSVTKYKNYQVYAIDANECHSNLFTVDYTDWDGPAIPPTCGNLIDGDITHEDPYDDNNPPNNDIIITTYTNWTAKSYYIDGDVYITNGVTLKIEDCFLKFKTCKGIIVEPGGNLEIIKSTLESCNETWKGIEVHGINDPAPDARIQAHLFMENSVIKDAEIAILSGKRENLNHYDDVTHSGGILEIVGNNLNCNANYQNPICRNYFSDNVESIVITNYQYMPLPDKLANIRNNDFVRLNDGLFGSFDDCYFDSQPIYFDQSKFPHHIMTQETSSILIENNLFNQPTNSSHYDEYNGIYIGRNCENISILNNEFTGYIHYAVCSDFAKNVNIEQNNFLVEEVTAGSGHAIIGIRNTGKDLNNRFILKNNSLIGDNIIKGVSLIMRPYVPSLGQVPHPLWMHGLMEKNTIQNTNIGIDYLVDSIISISNLIEVGDSNNVINNKVGVFINHPASITYSRTPIKFYCNQFNNNDTAAIIIDKGIIPEQGIPASGGFSGTAASNTFSNNGTTGNDDIYYNNNYSASDYHYLGGPAIHKPNSLGNSATITYNSVSYQEYLPIRLTPNSDPNASNCNHGGFPFKLENSIARDNNFSFSAFPNPFTNAFEINWISDENIQVQVIDYLGKSIYQNNFLSNQNKTRISTDNWASGLYLIQIHNTSGKLLASQKLIKTY